MAKRKSFLLRMDPRLWEELEALAGQEMRSINAQVEYLLKQAIIHRKGDRVFEKPSPEPGSDPDPEPSEECAEQEPKS